MRYGLHSSLFLDPLCSRYPRCLRIGVLLPAASTTLPSRRGLRWGSSLSLLCRFRNINRIHIGCPCRVRLSGRLTLGRLALPRNPWTCGVRVSHPHYRYLCLHLLFQALQNASRRAFAAPGMLPYQYKYSVASAPFLMPDYYQRPVTRPVSCYALFK